MVGYCWPYITRMASGTRIVPMLVQSCLNAFLATVWKAKDSPRASPRVLFCYFVSRPTSRSFPAPVPRCSTLTSLGPRAARPASRLFVQGPRALRRLITLLRGPRAESLPFVLLHCYITTSLHDCFYVFILLGNHTSGRSLT